MTWWTALATPATRTTASMSQRHRCSTPPTPPATATSSSSSAAAASSCTATASSLHHDQHHHHWGHRSPRCRRSHHRSSSRKSSISSPTSSAPRSSVSSHSTWVLLLLALCGAAVTGITGVTAQNIKFPLPIAASFPLSYRNPNAATGDDAADSDDNTAAMASRLVATGQLSAWTMNFAIGVVNADPFLLPYHTLTATTIDTGADPKTASDAAQATFSSQGRPVALLGDMSESVTSVLASLVSPLFRVPQLSYGARAAALSQKEFWPLLARMTPPENAAAAALVDVCRRFHWEQVDIIYSDNAVGRALVHAFKQARRALYSLRAEEPFVTAAFEYRLDLPAVVAIDAAATDDEADDRIEAALAEVDASPARVVLLLADTASLNRLFAVARQTKSEMLYAYDYQLLSVHRTLHRDISLNVASGAGDGADGYGKFLSGLISVELHTDARIKAAVDLAEACETQLPQQCGGRRRGVFGASADDSRLDVAQYYVYDAVTTLARALNIVNGTVARGRAVQEQDFSAASVLQTLTTQPSFDGVTGPVQLTHEGDRVAHYDIVNFVQHDDAEDPAVRRGTYRVVGEWRQQYDIGTVLEHNKMVGTLTLTRAITWRDPVVTAAAGGGVGVATGTTTSSAVSTGTASSQLLASVAGGNAVVAPDDVDSESFTVAVLGPVTGAPAGSNLGKLIHGFAELAVGDVNANVNLLPNRLLRIITGDDGNDPAIAFALTVDLIVRHRVDVIIGSTDTTTAAIAHAARAYDVPVISPSATSPAFAYKPTYPVFSRTVVQSDVAALAIVSFCTFYKWGILNVVTDNNPAHESFGRVVAQYFGTDRTFNMNIGNYNASSWDTGGDARIIDVLNEMELEASALTVLQMRQDRMIRFLEVAAQQGWLGKYTYFIAGDVGAENLLEGLSEEDRVRVLNLARGALIFTPPAFSQNATESLLERCKSLNSDCNNPYPPAVVGDGFATYDAVHAYARGMDAIVRGQRDEKDIDTVLSAIRSVEFTGATGRLEFDSRGNRRGVLDILNVQSQNIHRVGQYKQNPNDNFGVFEFTTTILWADGTDQVVRGKNLRTLENSASAKTLYSSISAGLCVINMLLVSFVAAKKRKPVVAASHPWMLQMLLFGNTLGHFSTIAWNLISQESNLHCYVPMFLWLMSFSTMFPAIAARVYRLWRRKFHNTQRIVLKRKEVVMKVIAMVMIESFLYILFLVFDQPRAQPREAEFKFQVWICTANTPIFFFLLATPPMCILFVAYNFAHYVRMEPHNYWEGARLKSSLFFWFLCTWIIWTGFAFYDDRHSALFNVYNIASIFMFATIVYNSFKHILKKELNESM